MWDILFQMIGGALIGAAVGYAICHWQDIVDWFNNYTSQNYVDQDVYGVLVKEKIAKGEYNLIQGIFNTRTGEYIDARRINSDQLDDETKRFMRGKKYRYIELYN